MQVRSGGGGGAPRVLSSYTPVSPYTGQTAYAARQVYKAAIERIIPRAVVTIVWKC
jgi:hypothetical protein